MRFRTKEMCWANCLYFSIFFFSLLHACIGKLQAKAVFTITTTRLCNDSISVVILVKKFSQPGGRARKSMPSFRSKTYILLPSHDTEAGEGQEVVDGRPSAWPRVCPSSRWFLHSSHPALFLLKHQGLRWKFQLKSTPPAELRPAWPRICRGDCPFISQLPYPPGCLSLAGRKGCLSSVQDFSWRNFEVFTRTLCHLLFLSARWDKPDGLKVSGLIPLLTHSLVFKHLCKWVSVEIVMCH